MSHSTYSIETASIICGRIAGGRSLRSVCADADMPSRATVNRWLADHAEFRARYATAHDIQADAIAEECLEIADDARGDWIERKRGDETIYVVDHEHIARARLRIDSRIWFASKLAPKKYGHKITQEHTGPDGGPMQIEVIQITIIEPKPRAA